MSIDRKVWKIIGMAWNGFLDLYSLRVQSSRVGGSRYLLCWDQRVGNVTSRA